MITRRFCRRRDSEFSVSMQILWVFFLSCVIDIVMQVIAVIEVATIDRTKMTLNGMKIAQWQYTMSLPVCGTGVLIK
eukprot:g5369.t1